MDVITIDDGDDDSGEKYYCYLNSRVHFRKEFFNNIKIFRGEYCKRCPFFFAFEINIYHCTVHFPGPNPVNMIDR